MILPISALREGHYIDLAEIADWLMLCPFESCPDCDSTYVAMEFEFAEVESGGEFETNECYRLNTTQGSFGLPPDLLVTVQGHQNDTYEMGLL